MLKEFDYQGDYLYQHFRRPSHQLFFRKMTSLRGFGPAPLLTVALPPKQLDLMQEFERSKTVSVLSVFGTSLLPVIFFRRIPGLKNRSRTFRIISSLIFVFVPTNILSFYYLGSERQLEDKIYRENQAKFRRYVHSGDIRAFGTDLKFIC